MRLQHAEHAAPNQYNRVASTHMHNFGASYAAGVVADIGVNNAAGAEEHSHDAKRRTRTLGITIKALPCAMPRTSVPGGVPPQGHTEHALHRLDITHPRPSLHRRRALIASAD
jgi:hypothetical protein